MHDLGEKRNRIKKKMLNTLDDVSVFLKVNHKKKSFFDFFDWNSSYKTAIVNVFWINFGFRGLLTWVRSANDFYIKSSLMRWATKNGIWKSLAFTPIPELDFRSRQPKWISTVFFETPASLCTFECYAKSWW